MRHHFVVILLCLIPGRFAVAQGTDSVEVSTRPAWLERHDPDLALKRSLMVPGLGQIYNRQYWKVPIVYAGIGAAVSLAIYYGGQHRLYTRAYQYRGWQQQLEEGEPHPFPEYADEYARVVADIGQGQDISASSLKPFRDKFRRNRDLSLFGVGLVYGLAALDAFISAHLLEFDVGEDLTASVAPFAGGQGVSIRVTW